MKVILSMSVSLNGIAARDNDSTNFLAHGEWPLFVELARQTGAMLWGRRTHEQVRSYGEQALQALDGTIRLVLSRDPQLRLEPGWQVATSPQHALALLEAAGQSQVVLGGGGQTNTAFALAGLVDEVIFYIGSVIVGRGVPSFAPHAFDLPLHLLEVQQARDEVVQLRYQARAESLPPAQA